MISFFFLLKTLFINIDYIFQKKLSFNHKQSNRRDVDENKDVYMVFLVPIKKK